MNAEYWVSMNRTTLLAAAFAAVVALAGGVAPAETILYSFTGLPGGVDTCKWFNDNIADRSIGALTRQTDLLYNLIALPAGTAVTIGHTARAADLAVAHMLPNGTGVTIATGSSDQAEELVDFKLGGKTVCTGADAIYGPTPSPSPTPAPSMSPMREMSPAPTPSSHS